MRAVYTSAHLAHDITIETWMGMPIPANEVAERAERIRGALEADGGFTIESPTAHGEAPITAVHEPGLVRFLEEAWSKHRAQRIPRAFLSADTYPNRAMFEGMSSDEVDRLVREPVQVGGRAGYWGLDSAAPLVAGTYAAARAAVDVALTTADLVLAGETAAYGLCRPPGHHAARSMYGGYCFFNNAAIAAEAIARATGEHVAILDVDYHHGNGDTADLLAARRRPLCLDPRRPRLRLPVFPRPGGRDGRRRRGRRELQPAPTTGDGRHGLPGGRRSGARDHRRVARLGDRGVTRLRHLRPRSDRDLRAHDRRVPRDRAADRGSRAPTGHPAGGRLPPPVARRERARLAARRRWPAARSTAGPRVRGGRRCRQLSSSTR